MDARRRRAGRGRRAPASGADDGAGDDPRHAADVARPRRGRRAERPARPRGHRRAARSPPSPPCSSCPSCTAGCAADRCRRASTRSWSDGRTGGLRGAAVTRGRRGEAAQAARRRGRHRRGVRAPLPSWGWCRGSGSGIGSPRTPQAEQRQRAEGHDGAPAARAGGRRRARCPVRPSRCSITGIYARTDGYLTARYVDIGDHVKAGQLLAEIDTPEVDQQLNQARATLAQGKANVVQAPGRSRRWRARRCSATSRPASAPCRSSRSTIA